MRAREVGPALQWAEEHRKALNGISSSLEFKLRSLAYTALLESNDRAAAVSYASEHFARFANAHFSEIKQLMGAVVFYKNLKSSHYVRCTVWRKY